MHAGSNGSFGTWSSKEVVQQILYWGGRVTLSSPNLMSQSALSRFKISWVSNINRFSLWFWSSVRKSALVHAYLEFRSRMQGQGEPLRMLWAFVWWYQWRRLPEPLIIDIGTVRCGSSPSVLKQIILFKPYFWLRSFFAGSRELWHTSWFIFWYTESIQWVKQLHSNLHM